MTTATLTASDAFPLAAPKKGRLKAFFNKAADMAGRAAVVNTLKIAAVSAVAGAGASGFVAIATAAAASGLGAALYSYGKDSVLDWRKNGRNAKFMDPVRLKKAKIALLAGVAGGAFGSWLAGTDFFKEGLHVAANKLSDIFMSSAVAAEITPMKPSLQTAFENIKTPSAQSLKDRAHDILRQKNLPWSERLPLARQMAEEAQRLGNKQSGAFLKDIAKLESLHLKPAALPVKLPEPFIPEKLSFDDSYAPGESQAIVATEPVPAPEEPVSRAEPFAPAFTAAATCTVSGAGGSYDAACTVHRETLAPKDYIRFVSAENPLAEAKITLAEGSDSVASRDFLHEKLVAEGVRQVAKLMP